MAFELVEISEITNNLDSKRIPLNSAQRKLKESNQLYPYVGANNILTYIDEYIFNEKILCVAEDGGSWGYMEKCSFIINEKCWVNNHAHVLTAKENLHLEYLMYYFNYADLSLYITGATRGKLNKGVLNKIKIPLPPLETQKRIAEILDNAAALRDKTEQLLEEYDALAQSIFLDMFGDPKLNPKGWEKEKLNNLGEIVTGNTPKRSREEYYGDYIEWIKTDNINTSNTYLTKAEEGLSKIGLEKGRLINEGGILMTCIAGSRKVIGNVAIADRKVAFNQQINAFQPFNSITEFWYYQFMISKSYIQSFATNGMKGIITKGKFKEIEFINPPIERQNEFAEKIALIEKQKDLAKQELQESEDLFNALLQKAFKGELV